MFSSSVLSLLVLSFYAIVAFGNESFTCLTDAEAQTLVDDFRTIAAKGSGYKEAAKRALTDDFNSISDSVNFADQIPLNTTMTHSRTELLQQESKLTPTGSVTDLFISHTCDTITWYFEFGTSPLPTRGIAILFVDANKKIYKSYREVNSAALLYNLGQPECQKNFTVSVGSAGPTPTEASCSKPCL